MEIFLQYSRGYLWKIPWVWEQCAGYPQIQRETAVGGKIVEGNPTGEGTECVTSWQIATALYYITLRFTLV